MAAAMRPEESSVVQPGNVNSSCQKPCSCLADERQAGGAASRFMLPSPSALIACNASLSARQSTPSTPIPAAPIVTQGDSSCWGAKSAAASGKSAGSLLTSLTGSGHGQRSRIRQLPGGLATSSVSSGVIGALSRPA